MSIESIEPEAREECLHRFQAIVIEKDDGKNDASSYGVSGELERYEHEQDLKLASGTIGSESGIRDKRWMSQRRWRWQRRPRLGWRH